MSAETFGSKTGHCSVNSAYSLPIEQNISTFANIY